jgi:predicted GH43/DUF377 family glycosyl hydrolase
MLQLDHPDAKFGQEDPRLFEFRGELYLSYHGVIGEKGPTNVLYARLGEDYQPREIFCPDIPGRAIWEKSHSYFEGADGKLYCVYSVGPAHRVLRIEGDQVVDSWESPYRLPWSGGHLRGGASPVLLPGGDRYGHWIHGRIDRNARGQDTWKRLYTLGYYEFESKPPFRTVRGTPDPLMVGNPAELRTWQKPAFPAVIWPAGAILENGRWRVSCGWQEEEIRIFGWDASELTESLYDARQLVTATR